MSGVYRWQVMNACNEFEEVVLASDYDRDTQALVAANMDFQVHFDAMKAERDTLRAQVEAMRACGWVRAVDQEMICSHIGVASEGDSYELAREKLASLIEWNVQVATDPSVNGGKMLVPIDLLCKVVRGDPSLGANARLLVDAWGAMAEIRTTISIAPSAALQVKP